MNSPAAGPTQGQALQPAPKPGWRLSTAVLAALLYLLLIDAAIETFWSGTGIRWWLLLAVVLYLGLSAAVWRVWPRAWAQLGASGRATATFIVLLGLLSAVTLTRGEYRLGLRMVGLATSTLLSVVVTFGMAVACITLVRLKILGLWIRCAVGATSAYAIAALAIGVASGTPFSGLFGGGSFWSRLPWWLQGVPLGAFLILLPAAVVQAARLPRLRTAPGSPAWRVVQLVTLAVSVLLGISGARRPISMGDWSRSGEQYGISTSRAVPPVRNFAEDDTKHLSADLTVLVAGLESVGHVSPLDELEPTAIVDAVGKDPDALFRWVRDNTDLVAYRGVLRGPLGVLLDRLGNSLDRSLLLARLLEIAGYDVQLANAALTKAQARDLREKARPARGETERPASSRAGQIGGEVASLQKQLGIDPAQAQRDVELASRLTAEAEKAARERIATYTRLLSGFTASLRPGAQQNHDDGLDDHWWVRLGQSGSWIDLDPSVPSAKPGEALASPQATFRVSELPESLLHRVHFRVIVERYSGGKLSEDVAFDQVLVPWQLIGKEITLLHLPMERLEALKGVKSDDGLNGLKVQALAESEWLPVLLVGNHAAMQFSFDTSGNVNRTPGRKGTPPGVAAQARGFSGALAGGEGAESASTPSSWLSAEWLEYEVEAPGRNPTLVRRELFDLVGPAARRAGTLSVSDVSASAKQVRSLSFLGVVHIVIQVSGVPRAVNQHEVNQRLLEQIRILRDQVAHRELTNSAELSFGILGALGATKDPAFSWAALRLAWNERRDDVYLDSVNIVNRRTGLALDSKEHLRTVESLDVVFNHISVGRKAAEDAVSARTTQGVVDTVTEAFVLGGLGPQRWAGQPFALAELGNVTWRVVQDPRGEVWRDGVVTADARERMQTDIDAGFVLVAPSSALLAGGQSRFGWWRIGRADGETIGVLDDGLHGAQPLSEWSETQLQERYIQELNWLHMHAAPWKPWPLEWPAQMTFSELCSLLSVETNGLSVPALRILYSLARTYGAII